MRLLINEALNYLNFCLINKNPDLFGPGFLYQI